MNKRDTVLVAVVVAQIGNPDVGGGAKLESVGTPSRLSAAIRVVFTEAEVQRVVERKRDGLGLRRCCQR